MSALAKLLKFADAQMKAAAMRCFRGYSGIISKGNFIGWEHNARLVQHDDTLR